MLTASPTAVIGTSTLHHLAPDPGVFQQAVGFGVGIMAQVGRAGATVLGYLTDSAVGQIALSVVFLAGTVVIGAACAVSVICPALGVSLALAPALLTNGGDLAGAISTTILDPARETWAGVRQLDPTALLIVATAVATLVITHGTLTFNPRLAKLQRTLLGPVCNRKGVWCVAMSKGGGETAPHIVDAVRGGAPRLLTLDRAGAQTRRASALRSVQRRKGFDRDEYPPAISTARRGLSVRHVDPSSNRRLGAYLGNQVDGIPDGGRLFVLPIA